MSMMVSWCINFHNALEQVPIEQIMLSNLVTHWQGRPLKREVSQRRLPEGNKQYSLAVYC